MSDEKNRSYIDFARDQMQNYLQALLRENEKLRAANMAVESDRRRLEPDIIEARGILRQREELRKASEELEASRNEILAAVVEAREDRDAAKKELDLLRSRFAEVEQENARYADQYHEIEVQSSNLSNLYVASYQLHASIDRPTVLNTILEIVINLIGSEEVAIYQADPLHGDLQVVASFGIESDGDVPRHHLESGSVWVNDGSEEGSLTACVPLKAGDTVIGAILVYRLLEHKPALQPVDHELFELLAVHAATALHCDVARTATGGGVMKSAVEVMTFAYRSRAAADEPNAGSYLYPGQMFVSTTPTKVTTILGSCVAVCLWDEVAGVGGINHFLLPSNLARGKSDLRYGNDAMTQLLEAVLNRGARQSRLRARIFGGASVLDGLARMTIGEQNIAVAREFLSSNQIEITLDQTGGRRGRKLVFHTGNGCASVKEI